MEPKTIIIFVLLGICVLAYFKPDMYTQYVSQGINTTKSIIPLNFGQKPNVNGASDCIGVTDPVCGLNGVSYQNACFALKAGTNYTGGACAISNTTK